MSNRPAVGGGGFRFCHLFLGCRALFMCIVSVALSGHPKPYQVSPIIPLKGPSQNKMGVTLFGLLVFVNF